MMVDPILSPSADMAEAGGPRKTVRGNFRLRVLGRSGFSEAWPLQPSTELCNALRLHHLYAILQRGL